MTRKESGGVMYTLLLVAVAALATMLTYAQRALADDGDDQEERIVEISPNADAGELTADEAVDQAPAAPTYWLGIQGRPLDSAVLRTHLQLAEGVGVVVEGVADDSPAKKAGLRKHDVLLDVNGDQISDMTVLKKAVADSNGKPIELKLIRLAKEIRIAVTPEKAPEGLAQAGGGFGFGGNFNANELNHLFRGLPGGFGGGMQMIGPGMILRGQGAGVAQLPGGVEVRITRDGDGPATVTVTKGGKTWTVHSDDDKAIAELPDDVRPFVEQMLKGGGGMLQLPGNLEGMLPDRLGNFEFNFDADAIQRAARAHAGAAARHAEEASERLQERMQRLEQQLEELRGRLEENSQPGTNPAADPSNT